MNTRLLQQFDESVRRRGRYIGRRVEQLPRVTRVTGPTASQFDNLIPWTDLDDSTSDGEIDAQLAHFDSLGHNFAWFVYGHDQPRNLVDRLLARGLEVDSQEEVVIASARELRDHFPPAEVQVRRIDDAAQIADLLRVQQVVWGDEHVDFVTRWLTQLVVDAFEESIVLVAYVQEEPVAAAWSTLWNGCSFAPLFGGTVLPAWRGRGIYRALVAARARAAVGRGIEWCYADAGDESLPILRRLGFAPVTRRTCLRWRAAERGR